MGRLPVSDKKGEQKLKTEFGELMEEVGHCPQQIFIINETGFWKVMPRRMYISKDEITLRGHKPVKDRLILLFDSNASGDFKLRPRHTYHSDNTRVLK
jgi:hypothetical protein